MVKFIYLDYYHLMVIKILNLTFLIKMVCLQSLNMFLNFIHVLLTNVRLVQLFRIVFYVFNHIFYNLLYVFNNVMLDFININDIAYFNVLLIPFPFNHLINVNLALVHAKHVHHKLNVYHA